MTAPYLALMVYGSQARGTADSGSDVDVLALVDQRPGSYQVGRVSVTAYAPAQLHAMAQDSSLFVLHLKTEGILLEDPQGTLSRALDAYTPIADFASHRQQIRAVAPALNVHRDLFATHGQGLARMGLYLLRTALYLEAAEAGRPDFDALAAAKARGEDEVVRACALKRATWFEASDLRLLDRALSALLRHESHEPIKTAEELQTRALFLSDASPHASALLVNVLYGHTDVDYVGVTAAPW